MPRHERGTLEAVIKARNAAVAAQGPAQQAQAENMLSGALRQLFALSEAYPDLKANPNFQQLQAELSDIENKLAAARRFFNNAVQEYNTGIQQFPAVLFAGPLGFRAARRSSISARQRAGARAGAAGEVLVARVTAAAGSGRCMAAAYGLYTHIQSNRRRSVAAADRAVLPRLPDGVRRRAAGRGDDSATPRSQWLLRAAWRDLLLASPFATVGDGAVDRHRLQVPPVADRRGDRRPRRRRARRSRGSTICWKTSASRAASPMPKLKIMENAALNAFASGMNEKQ